MAVFGDLPTETRILILQHLGSIDLQSFLISQASPADPYLFPCLVLKKKKSTDESRWHVVEHLITSPRLTPRHLARALQTTDRPLREPPDCATCRTFHLLAKEILSHPQGLPRPADEDSDKKRKKDEEDEQAGRPAALPISTTPRTAANPVLARAFAPLFSSAACFTAEERRRARWFLSLNGDAAKPFRRLPWAAGASPAACGKNAARGGDVGGGGDGRREAYLRPGASWRDVSVTFARGAPITRLEIVKSYSSEDLSEEGRDHVQHLLVDLLPPPPSSSSPSSSSSSPAGGGGGGFLTMGALYDLLLAHGPVGDDGAATFGAETGAWDLLLGRRLRSYGLLVEYECFIADDEELVDLCPEAEGAAILYVRGGSTVEVDGGDQDRRFAGDDQDEKEDEDGRWVPEMLGERPRIRLANVP